MSPILEYFKSRRLQRNSRFRIKTPQDPHLPFLESSNERPEGSDDAIIQRELTFGWASSIVDVERFRLRGFPIQWSRGTIASNDN